MLVTGGSSGIGQAIAVRFAEYGANVAINYLRQPEEAHDTEEQVHACIDKVAQEGVQDVLVGGDVSNEEDVVRMVGEAAEGLGGLDVLVNNAGIQISRPTRGAVQRGLRQASSPSTCAARSCARARRSATSSPTDGRLDRQRLERPPADPEARLPRLLDVSKGGMQNLTRTLALEYAARGIRVNGVGPGATVTPINRAWIDDPVKRAQVEEHIPMRARRRRRRDGGRDVLPRQRRSPPTSPARRSSSTAA